MELWQKYALSLCFLFINENKTYPQAKYTFFMLKYQNTLRFLNFGIFLLPGIFSSNIRFEEEDSTLLFCNKTVSIKNAHFELKAFTLDNFRI